MLSFCDLTQECEGERLAESWKGGIDAFEFCGKGNALTSIGSGSQSAFESLRHIACSAFRKRTIFTHAKWPREVWDIGCQRKPCVTWMLQLQKITCTVDDKLWGAPSSFCSPTIHNVMMFLLATVRTLRVTILRDEHEISPRVASSDKLFFLLPVC